MYEEDENLEEAYLDEDEDIETEEDNEEAYGYDLLFEDEEEDTVDSQSFLDDLFSNTPNSMYSDNAYNRISAIESGGNYRAESKNSSAVGKFQFLWKTHGNWISNLTGVHSKEEFKNSPAAQEAAYAYWDKTTLTPVARRYSGIIPGASEDDLKAMIHFAGEGNLRKAIKTGNFSKPLDANGTSINKYVGRKYAFGGEVIEDPINGILLPEVTVKGQRNNNPFTAAGARMSGDYINRLKSDPRYKDHPWDVASPLDMFSPIIDYPGAVLDQLTHTADNTILKPSTVIDATTVADLKVPVIAGGLLKKAIPAIKQSIKNVGDNVETYKLARNKFNTDNPIRFWDLPFNEKVTNKVDHLVDQQNTFKRGVAIERSKDPYYVTEGRFQLTRDQFMRDYGIDPTNLSDEKLAEFFATKIPKNPMGGTAAGSGVLYTSNSDLTARGYSYGKGYIATVKNKTDSYKGLSNLDKINRLDNQFVRGSIETVKPADMLAMSNPKAAKALESYESFARKKSDLRSKLSTKIAKLDEEIVKPARQAQWDNRNYKSEIVNRLSESKVNSMIKETLNDNPNQLKEWLGSRDKYKALENTPYDKLDWSTKADFLTGIGKVPYLDKEVMKKIDQKEQLKGNKLHQKFKDAQNLFDTKVEPIRQALTRTSPSTGRLEHPITKSNQYLDNLPLAFEHDVDDLRSYAHRTIRDDRNLSVSKLEKVDDGDWQSFTRAHHGNRTDGFFPKKYYGEKAKVKDLVVDDLLGSTKAGKFTAKGIKSVSEMPTGHKVGLSTLSLLGGTYAWLDANKDKIEEVKARREKKRLEREASKRKASKYKFGG